MENASKALLMAAGVLMGVLILSLAVFLFANFRSTANESLKRMEEEETAQFNSFYVAYDGQTDLNYYDIWNVVNKAKENNKKYNLTQKEGNNFYIEVYRKYNNVNTELTKNNSFEVTSADQLSSANKGVMNSGQMVKYKCSVKINDVTGRVEKVQFEQSTN